MLSQTLLSRLAGGRIAAFEIMLADSVIRRLIREEKVFEISAQLEMCRLEGMQTLDQAMADLVKSGVVSKEEAILKTSSPVRLNKLLMVENGVMPTDGATPQPSRTSPLDSLFNL